MYVFLAGGDAAPRLHRRDHDALAAGAGLSWRRAICRPSITTRSSPRTARIMIFFVAMPFVIGLMNFVVPLQLGVRDVAFPTLNSVGFWLTATGALLVNISLVVGEFARTGWLPYPPLSELDVFARRRRRLLSVVAADLRRRHAADRRQLRHHDPEDARPGHDLYAHADVLLDGARLQSADRRRLSDPDRDPGDAAAGPLPRLSLLHQRSRRQRDDVHEPDLGVGASRRSTS